MPWNKKKDVKYNKGTITICNVIQNVKGNAGAMKYIDIKCNAVTIKTCSVAS